MRIHAPSPTGHVLALPEGVPTAARGGLRPIPELTVLVLTRAPHGAIALQRQAEFAVGCDGLYI